MSSGRSDVPTASPRIPVGSSDVISEQDRRELIGESAVFLQLCRQAGGVARRHSTVLVLGETGTGKEVLARHIHRCSDRAHQPFVPVDCASLPEPLFESQLFGHCRGAFTGASRDALGAVRSADRGTLFLDEVGELSLPVQSKLLRALQERAVVPVGETSPRPVDIRIIAATHRDLQAMVATGAFRQDLFFRLHVVVLRMPPLRERKEDILLLGRHFLNQQAAMYDEAPKTLSDEAAQAMTAYQWPGNIRELANAMEQAHVLAATQIIGVADLPGQITSPAPVGIPVPSATSGGDLSVLDLERRAITEALRRTRWNKAAASRLLQMNVKRLNRRMTRMGITVPDHPAE